MDKRVNNKGTKGNKGGRPSKAQEQKANYIFTTALKRIYNEEEDDEAKIKFVQELSESQRGQIFIAEHLFGKAPQTLDVNTTQQGDISFKRWLDKNKTE